MTVWVFRGGALVEKASFADAIADKRSAFPSPSVSRLTPYESPVTGKEISTWRERDADMKAVDAVDPRDLPKDLRRSRANQKKEAKNVRSKPDPAPFKWGGTAPGS